MSLLPLATFSAPGVPLYGSGGGGGGGGSNIVASSITLTGPNPISATLTSGGNDGFEVRNGGGGSNVIADLTIDAGNPASAEMGIRVLSTISATTALVDRFELFTTPSTLNSGLIKSNNTSTLGQITFGFQGDLGLGALPTASGGAGTGITLSGTASTITFYPQLAQACHSKIAISTNTYVPAAGTTQAMGNFPSIAGHVYDIRLPVRIDAVSAPAAGDWAVITTDTSTAPVALATFDLVQVSSVANQYESHLCGTVIASGTTTTLLAEGKIGAGTSTAVTVAGSSAWIRDLGIPVAP